MKKLLPLALALLCLCSVVPAALAEDLTNELPELSLSICSPEGWFVFTQDVDEDDPNLKLLGKDGDGLADFFKGNGTYLDMISADSNAEIYVAMIGSEGGRDIHDFNLISDEDALLSVSEIQEMQKQPAKQLSFSGGIVYKHKQAKFVYYDYTWQTEGETVYGIQYCTVINGKIIIISMSSGAGQITVSLAQTLKSTVDSIIFTEVTPKPADDLTAVYACLTGAAAGVITCATVFAKRKGRPR